MKDDGARAAIRELAAMFDRQRQGGPISAEAVNSVLTLVGDDAPYGFCPVCGEPGVSRERRIDGDDKCNNGHRYYTKSALTAEEAAERRKRYVETT